MKTPGVSATMGTRTDGSATLGCPGRLQRIIFRKSASSMFSIMPFAARPVLAGHRQPDAPAQNKFRVSRDGHPNGRIRHIGVPRKHPWQNQSKKCFLYVFQNALRSTFGPRGSPSGGRASPNKVTREPDWHPNGTRMDGSATLECRGRLRAKKI